MHMPVHSITSRTRHVLQDGTLSLLHIAEHGLPKTSDPKHVIIIGAGIAGLTAGKLLKNVGLKVTILEASDRVGGRIYTYRDPQDRYYVDMGAMRIPENDHFVNAFVKRFKLTTNPFVIFDENTLYYINGRKSRSSEVDANPDILGYDTSALEKGKTAAELLGEVLQPILEDCYKCGELQVDCLKKYDNYSIQSYIAEVAHLSQGATSMIGALYLGDIFSTAFTNIVGTLTKFRHPFYEITGGMDLLPKAFLPSLQDNIVFNAKVNHVVHGNGSVAAHYLSNGTNEQIFGDYLLTTATAMSTAFIRFTPEFRSEKREAFRNINYIGATKIVLVFERPFWEEEDIHGGGSNTDLLIKEIIYPSHGFDSGLGVLIASYAAGDRNKKFLSLTDTECISLALDGVARVHGDHVRYIFVEGVVKRWQLDPYSNGAWTALTPYQLRNYYDAIVRPTSELFFAGEHTSYPHGWINEPIKSAVEAVRCISDKGCYPFLENGETDY